ncbi:hypothetical protein ATANTOWER_016072 [Ataeniobius toweri]|uniref:Uncharacterized protein n=1 Tax=Ataeniobius toweri TaxID=208326 RepID=A0ABU7BMZ7_9TELE|nr:hypothetical protein [Ataeniobius toweri]
MVVLPCDGLATCPGSTPLLACRPLEIGTSSPATRYRRRTWMEKEIGLTDEKVKAYLALHPQMLDEFVLESVSAETLDRWLKRKTSSRPADDTSTKEVSRQQKLIVLHFISWENATIVYVYTLHGGPRMAIQASSRLAPSHTGQPLPLTLPRLAKHC